MIIKVAVLSSDGLADDPLHAFRTMRRKRLQSDFASLICLALGVQAVFLCLAIRLPNQEVTCLGDLQLASTAAAPACIFVFRMLQLQLLGPCHYSCQYCCPECATVIVVAVATAATTIATTPRAALALSLLSCRSSL